MLSQKFLQALDRLAASWQERPDIQAEFVHRWSGVSAWADGSAHVSVFPPDMHNVADGISNEFKKFFGSNYEANEIKELMSAQRCPVWLTWFGAQMQNSNVRQALALSIAAEDPKYKSRASALARDRVVHGPLLDALKCAPLVGGGALLRLPEYAQVRARLEILMWEAGAEALALPFIGEWIWRSPATFEVMVHEPARGTLRGRVQAARCLEVSVCGMPAQADPALVGRTLQVLQPLLLHPEPLVWVHAARALGRLTGTLEQLEGTLLDWVQGNSPILRQRATTAFASLPAARLNFLASQLKAIIDTTDEPGPTLAAVAAATPYLFFERRKLWDRLASRILAGDGGALAARALARGLATLWRRGEHRAEIETPMHRLREMARRARAHALDEARRWIEVTAVTDVVDSAERDPLDLELGLENLIRIAAQYDDEEADARAARFAASMATAFAEANRAALGAGKLRQRASAINALEGCARAFALRLWVPMLVTQPSGENIEEPNLDDTWKLIASAPADILDFVKEARLGATNLNDEYVALEVLAIRLGGYALDACGEDADLGPGRGPTAHDTCRWLRKVEGLADGTRELSLNLQQAQSALLWRLVDITRGTSLGEVDDVQWLGPFAAWWALVIDRPAMLLQLANALPMMATGALEHCCESAETLRHAVSSNKPDGTWFGDVRRVLKALQAFDTELAQALAGLADTLAEFKVAAGPRPQLEAMCLDLVLAGERLQAALADPVKALHPARDNLDEDSLSRRMTQNAPRIAGLVARAIRARELSMLDVWFASLGPVASALLEEAVRGAIRRTPPPPPTAKKKEPKSIQGYDLVKPLGEGGVGSVWLVRRPGADRLFVLKVPKADALANATDVEREGIIATFVKEAEALAGLYHPNVANIIDRGVADGMPFLVLEYLIGADLKHYAAAQLMTLFELRQVILDACAGLSALHGAGLVHRDIKPANIWLRLPLTGGQRFDPQKHRDPAHVHPLAAVVIDFGMVRSIKVPPDAAGRFVAGTAGYIAPEQVLDPIELDPRSDVYALAATVYNVTTGRAFFDDIENQRDRIIAHMRRDPFEEAERLRPFPAAVAKLLRAATQQDPRARPTPLEFGVAFADAI